jgi:hypothetical protein
MAGLDPTVDAFAPAARSAKIVQSLQQICLTGKSLARFRDPRVQPLLQKYFRFRLTQITSISITVSFRQEGRSRVVTSAGRDAVDVKAPGAQWQSQGEMNLVSGQRRAR